MYYSVVIGGSEGVEYATGELFSALAPGLIKAIPFLGKITQSLADGLVNATLLTRVSLITENYCRLTFIEKESDLYPKYKSVLSATKHILHLMRDKKTLVEDEMSSSDALNELYALNAKERSRARKDSIGCLIWFIFLVGGVLFIVLRFASM